MSLLQGSFTDSGKAASVVIEQAANHARLSEFSGGLVVDLIPADTAFRHAARTSNQYRFREAA